MGIYRGDRGGSGIRVFFGAKPKPEQFLDFWFFTDRTRPKRKKPPKRAGLGRFRGRVGPIVLNFQPNTTLLAIQIFTIFLMTIQTFYIAQDPSQFSYFITIKIII